MESNTSPAPLHCTVGHVWFLCIGNHIRYDINGSSRYDCIRMAKAEFCRTHKWPQDFEWAYQRSLKENDKWSTFVKWGICFFDAPLTVRLFDVRPNTKLTRPASDAAPATGGDGLGASDLLGADHQPEK